MISTNYSSSTNNSGTQSLSSTNISGNNSREPPDLDVPRVVINQASVELPFSPRIAYFAFGDFTRHSQWNPHVTSVEYVDASRTEARWTMQIFGMKFGWSTIPVRKEPNKLIVWKSVKGLQLQARAEFEPLSDGECRMLYTLSYEAPRKLKYQGDSKKESAQLRLMLETFRDVVAKDLQENHATN